MIVGDRVIGVISVDKFEPDFYNEELAELATAFAAQAAIAIENARLLETERAAREQAETLRAAAHSLGSTLGVPEVFDLILTELRKVVPYESASVQQLDGNDLVIVGGYGYPNLEQMIGLRYRLGGAGRSRPRAGRAARDPHRSGRRRSGSRNSRIPTAKGMIKSWMAVPLAGRRPADRHADASTASSQTSTRRSTRGRRRHSQRSPRRRSTRHATSSELERAREHAETLLTVTQVLGKTLSLEQTIEAILDELQRVVPYDSCSVQVIQGNRLVIVGGRGFDDLDGLLGAGLRPGRRERT